MQASEILKRYLTFFEKRGHKRIPNSPLVLHNDPTTLFTSSGMQPLIPYLLREPHPDGTRLVNAQNCIRSQDIEEVGDNRHTTFFRMLGNWGLGDPASPDSGQGGYFKKDQIPWFFEFLTSIDEGLGLNPQKLYVTVFAGNNEVPKDTESMEIWKDVFKKVGIEAEENERIFLYGVEKNWWSRSGTPDKMPAGEPGGPDSEVFYEFTDVEHNSSYGKTCHPNCDCGRFMEIGNSVFMEYQKQEDGSFKPLPNQNVDFGGGLERFAAAVNEDPDIFATDLYKEIIDTIEKHSDKKYADEENKASMRVIADHLKAATFLMKDGVNPSNKEQGYILRRLLRRSAVKMHQLRGGLPPIPTFKSIVENVLSIEETIDEKTSKKKDLKIIEPIIEDEMNKFAKSLDRGLKEIEKMKTVDAQAAFDLFQSYGFPFEIVQELLQQKGQTINKEDFDTLRQEHASKSRTASAGKFRGGLADHQEKTIMGHTATHLLHQALRDVLGNHVFQTGSNITTERLRFDFNYDKALTPEELQKVEDIINEKIQENLPVHFEMIPTQDAKKMGAIGLFEDTYGDKSKIYFIGGDSQNPKESYSIEFCGGPHVDFTEALKRVKIIKQENIGHGQRRIYAGVEI